MLKRKLGRTGIDISPLCFGGNVFGWTIDQPRSFELLDAFVAAGGNFIDTADVYSAWVPGNKGGESETIIGNWLKARGKRDNVIIATKVGMKVDGENGLSKAHIFRAVEASLKRLQTDYIDLYQSHIDDPETPLEETLSAYDDLLKQGKIRSIGASNYSAARLTEALELAASKNLPTYQVLQPLYNLYDRKEYEDALEGVCKKYELGVINYFALAAGFLTGKYRSKEDLNNRARGIRVEKYVTPRGMHILEALDQLAKEYNTTQACVALTWLLTRDSISAPIVSATSLEQLSQIIASTSLKLDTQAIALLDQASA